ncbi:hypothetical protein [Archaeoglobus sp.]|uniref:hypothetical protein n=1 Tax=Archaeoglobus sp. TaxID=1872626 RepID=UPI0024AC314E|nr:hypothetical protein [Archaeoglobus sp.]MDI3498263.1 hypothetical protein [Archaeoglobus sp.]
MNKKALGVGMVLVLSFLAVLAVMLNPLFDGKNFVAYADDRFSAYAKHSSYFIPEIKSRAEKLHSAISLEIDMKDVESARKTAMLYANFAEQKGSKVFINGKLGEILVLALNDADRGYYNDESYFKEKYGMSAKEALYLWHTSLSAIAKKLEQEGRFEESLFIKTQVLTRGVEPAYNFYGIDAKPMDAIGGALLVFYVVYTLWWGFAVYFVFEGLGISVKKAESKKEV